MVCRKVFTVPSNLLVAVGLLAFGASVSANEVRLTILNNTDDPIRLTSGTPWGSLPASLAPKESRTITLRFTGTRSDIEAVYMRQGSGTACRFTASHILHGDRPTFDHGAVSLDPPRSACGSTQGPRYAPPWDYSAGFTFYF